MIEALKFCVINYRQDPKTILEQINRNFNTSSIVIVCNNFEVKLKERSLEQALRYLFPSFKEATNLEDYYLEVASKEIQPEIFTLESWEDSIRWETHLFIEGKMLQLWLKSSATSIIAALHVTLFDEMTCEVKRESDTISRREIHAENKKEERDRKSVSRKTIVFTCESEALLPIVEDLAKLSRTKFRIKILLNENNKERAALFYFYNMKNREDDNARDIAREKWGELTYWIPCYVEGTAAPTDPICARLKINRQNRLEITEKEKEAVMKQLGERINVYQISE